METTTDLDVIRKQPRRFTWGKVEKIHDVGRYTIVEHMSHMPPRARSFHVYVDGKDRSTSTGTLEGALLLAIAEGAMECNSARYAAIFAAKMMGLP